MTEYMAKLLDPGSPHQLLSVNPSEVLLPIKSSREANKFNTWKTVSESQPSKMQMTGMSSEDHLQNIPRNICKIS